MKSFQEKFNKVANSIQLQPEEQARVRGVLLAHMQQSQKPLISPYFNTAWMHFSSLHIRSQYISIFILTILVCGGVSASAEHSLPGQALYQVKTSVNENIRSLFSFTPESKAQLHAELAVRRLQEVEQLAVTGQLDSVTKTTAEKTISQHIDAVTNNVLTLEKENNANAAADTASNLASNLSGQAVVLSKLAKNDPSVSDVAAQINVAAQTVAQATLTADNSIATDTLDSDLVTTKEGAAKNDIETVSSLVSSTDATLSASTSIATSTNFGTTTAVILDNETSTASTTIVNTASSSVAQATSTPGATTTVQVNVLQQKFADATAALKKGESQLAAKNYRAAFISFQKAQQIAQEIKVILDAEQNLKTTDAPISETQGATSTTAAVINAVATSTIDSLATSTATTSLK